MPKPSRAQLKNLIDVVLISINPSTSVYLNRNTADAAYAGYVFGLVLRAVERVADPQSVRLDSAQSGLIPAPPPGVFVIRGAPGPLYSKDQNFGFACFSYQGEKYEVHLGAQYRGSSEVLHEFDVSIIPTKAADESRGTRRPPGPGKPCAVFECKFYGRKLGIELAREFVGLRSDFTSVPMARLVTNSDSGSVALFLRKSNRPKMSRYIQPNNKSREDEFICAIADELRNSL
jgi:hypothetical protein